MTSYGSVVYVVRNDELQGPQHIASTREKAEAWARKSPQRLWCRVEDILVVEVDGEICNSEQATEPESPSPT